jgi:capsular exopolysaccharide synthesis family protein
MEKFKTPSEQETKLHFLDYWRIIRIRKTVILAVFLLVVLTTTAVTYMLPKYYMSTARIAVEKEAPDVDPLGGTRVVNAYDPYFIQTEFEKIQSKEYLKQVVEDRELNLNERWKKYNDGVPLKTSESISILKRQLEVRQFRNTSLIEIRVLSRDREEASEIANKIAEVYLAKRLQQRRASADRGIAKLKSQWEAQDKKVKEAQALVDKLREQHNVPDLLAEGPGGYTINSEIMRNKEARRTAAQEEYVSLNAALTMLKGLSREELRDALPVQFSDSQLLDLMQRKTSAEQELAATLKEKTENHPDVQRLKTLISQVSQQIEGRLDGIMVGLEAKVAAAKAKRDTLEDELKAAQEMDIKKFKEYRPYFQAKLDLETQRKLREVLSLKIAQEEIDAEISRGSSSIVEITDKAEPGLRPVRPNVPLNIALGVIVGLVVGVGLAFFIEYLDTSVKTIDDVERAMQAPVLGVIPQNVGSLLDEGPESPHAEAYRVLRTNILFSRKDEKLNSITVVSGGAGEGKSTTLFNLATVFAQNGERVLIVDSDLRRPSIHKFLRVSNSIGLTNYLLKQNTLEEVIQTTPLPGLDFMPSGKLPSSSLGILNSVQMKEMIKDLKRRYDFVFFDSPPIMGVSDASILASEVDLSLQIIQYRKYPQAMTIRAKQMVEKVGGTLIGVVLNNINMSQDENYYYYSGYYYDYYSKREDETSARKSDAQKAGSGKREQIDLRKKY